MTMPESVSPKRSIQEKIGISYSEFSEPDMAVPLFCNQCGKRGEISAPIMICGLLASPLTFCSRRCFYECMKGMTLHE
jgi:hypothetical protein